MARSIPPPQTPGRIGWPQAAPAAAPPALPVAMPPRPAVAQVEPGSPEHLNAAAQAYARSPNMRTVIAYDHAREMMENRQAQALQAAQMAHLGAQTEGVRLTNQGIPAETQLTSAKAQTEAAQALMAAQTARMTPTDRQVLSGIGAGITPESRGREIEDALKLGGALTPDTARVALLRSMPQADLDQITGPAEKRLSPWESHAMAGRLGYGAAGLNDPRSAFSNNLRTYLQSTAAPDMWARAQSEDPYNPSTLPLLDQLAHYLGFLPGAGEDPKTQAAHAQARAWLMGRRFGRPQVAPIQSP
jgi:hypothetical protein